MNAQDINGAAALLLFGGCAAVWIGSAVRAIVRRMRYHRFRHPRPAPDLPPGWNAYPVSHHGRALFRVSLIERDVRQLVMYYGRDAEAEATKRWQAAVESGNLADMSYWADVCDALGATVPDGAA